MPGVEVLRDLSDAFVEGGRRRRLSRPAARTHVLTCNIVFAGAIAFPPEQAVHPGWRAMPASGSELPAGTFLWIGERGAPELAIIRRSRKITPLYVNENAAIVKVN